MSVDLKIGDKVAVIDEVITGIVNNIEGDIIRIETDDGFALDFKRSELVILKEDQGEFSKYIDIKHDALIEKERSSFKKKSLKRTKSREQAPLEVDLHIHHLTKSTKGMTNHEMLTLQLETARRQLEFAIKKKIQRVILIHGVGEGVLQKEIEFLLGRYHVSVQPASFQKYGFGATEVYIYQNQEN